MLLIIGRMEALLGVLQSPRPSEGLMRGRKKAGTYHILEDQKTEEIKFLT